MATSDNRRVAKNAVALTLRMVLVTIVGLFTSRVVLQALGVDDYGIYGVIGGVVGMASFLNTAMAGATSRFITFELGRGNTDKLRTIFSSALLIHIVIALVVALLAETVGLWFVNNCMNFPPDRMYAVNVLYQFTILSMIVGFTQVPYSAAIIAHERMNIYAYFEIINVVLKLAIVYLLMIVDTDRLILYASLLLAVSILMALIYRIYCVRHFAECRFTATRDRATITAMLKFAGLDLCGNMCYAAKSQGQPVILNMFFGVAANAAASIGATVANSISGLTTTISQAFRPQIIKQYATGDIDTMTVTMRRSVQFTLLAYSIFALPFLFEASRIIYLWLGQVPQYTVAFLRIIIIISGISITNTVAIAPIHATGNIKIISFFSGSMQLSCPILTYLIFRFFNGEVLTGYYVDCIISALIALTLFGILKKQIPQIRINLYFIGILKSIIVIVASALLLFFINKHLIETTNVATEQIGQSLLVCAFVFVENALILVPLFLIFALDKTDRNILFNKIKAKLRFKRNRVED